MIKEYDNTTYHINRDRSICTSRHSRLGNTATGLLGGLLGEGITGCIGCFFKFFWVILLIAIFIALIQ